MKKFLIIVPGLSFTLVSEDVPDGEVVQVVVGITIKLYTPPTNYHPDFIIKSFLCV